LLAAPAWGQGSAHVAALQAALSAKGIYAGTVDGVLGPDTRAAVARFQRAAGLPADGIAGPRTRRALGRYGRPAIGSRTLSRGAVGWDVAALQFRLAWHGFPSREFDAVFDQRTEAAVIAFQQWAGLVVDGRAGPETLRALRADPASSPIRLNWPLRGAVSSGFGPRGNRFHEGIDITAGEGTRVGAALGGRVVFADWNDGFGQLVTIAHHHGVTTLYAHLSRILVIVGQRVSAGSEIGRVGHTGHASGPHLHFEVRLRGASVDPLTALG
ncbi:MAG: peptidoglycan-binding protein, partial [Actinobacteria bacterium]|nr:peptidoglycan-binding protein [Actinomycetota bacterium]